jgi:hypothetical protein
MIYSVWFVSRSLKGPDGGVCDLRSQLKTGSGSGSDVVDSQDNLE